MFFIAIILCNLCTLYDLLNVCNIADFQDPFMEESMEGKSCKSIQATTLKVLVNEKVIRIHQICPFST